MFLSDVLEPLATKNLCDDGIICWNYMWRCTPSSVNFAPNTHTDKYVFSNVARVMLAGADKNKNSLHNDRIKIGKHIFL